MKKYFLSLIGRIIVILLCSFGISLMLFRLSNGDWNFEIIFVITSISITILYFTIKTVYLEKNNDFLENQIKNNENYKHRLGKLKENYLEISEKREAEQTEKIQNLKSEYHTDISNLNMEIEKQKHSFEKTIRKLEKVQRKELLKLQNTISEQESQLKSYTDVLHSNLTLFPFAAKAFAEYVTVDLEAKAKSIDWGSDVKRLKKVEDIRTLRKEAKEQIEKIKWSEYQLNYLLELYPPLQDVIDTEYQELNLSINNVTEYDPVRNYLSSDEWKALSESQRNQLALDRYVESRKKSKWQIGRDYELYVGYLYENKGYKVNYIGSYLGLEDLGRDLIVEKDDKIAIIQCKYWSKEKLIHEKHIMQLYGTVIAYNIENPRLFEATGILFTNIQLSETAKKYADILKIKYIENKDIASFPRIKCNIGKDEFGMPTKIYHLPMDLQYDKVKLDKPDETTVTMVVEAEQLGFRRAYKWHNK